MPHFALLILIGLVSILPKLAAVEAREITRLLEEELVRQRLKLRAYPKTL